jgi:hypothetical protein
MLLKDKSSFRKEMIKAWMMQLNIILQGCEMKKE